MARMIMEGMEELLKEFEKEEKSTSKVAKNMLKAGGEVMVQEIREQIKKFNVFDSGATWWGVKVGSVMRTDFGIKVEVWPAGTREDKKHPNGERVETVAFINEYGSSKLPPRPFMSAAVRSGERKVAEKMMNVWEKSRK